MSKKFLIYSLLFCMAASSARPIVLTRRVRQKRAAINVVARELRNERIENFDNLRAKFQQWAELAYELSNSDPDDDSRMFYRNNIIAVAVARTLPPE